MDERMWLPSLSHFLNGNGWSGSEGKLRFEIEAPAEELLTAVLWQDPFTRKYAEELFRQQFEVSEEGLAALADWLVEKAAEVNAAPPRTPEALRTWRDQVKAKEAEAAG